MVIAHSAKRKTGYPARRRGARDKRNYAQIEVRDKDGHEVDFLITERRKPWLLIEAKESEIDLAPALARFQDQLKVSSVQLVNRPGIARRFKRASGETGILSASQWLAGLP